MTLSSRVNDLAARIAAEIKSVWTAVGSKADDSAVVHNTGTETIGGAKTFSVAPQVPVGALLANPVRRDDARLSDARTPLAHASSHAPGGTDPLTGYVTSTQVGAASGVASLDSGGKIPQAQLPAVALTEFLGAVASQTAMLALSGQRGDWCTRTDLGTDWQLIAEPSSTLANWRQMTYPASPVNSVNGRTGSVTGLAEASDVATSLAGKVDTTRSVTAGTGLSGGGSLAADRSFAVVYGTTAGTAAQGNDSRLSNARTPTAHASTHASGGSDPITPASIGAASASPLVCAAHQTSAQSIPHNAWTVVTLNAETIDTHNIHSTSTNPSRLVIPSGWDGIYRIEGVVAVFGAGTKKAVAIYKNGVRLLGAVQSQGQSNDDAVSTPSRLVQLVAGDYIEVGVYQNSGSAQSTIVLSDTCSALNLEFVRA